jgi:hypothetical protein
MRQKPTGRKKGKLRFAAEIINDKKHLELKINTIEELIAR